jgi:glycosyltransferase involved in cell wall biosynthesis
MDDLPDSEQYRHHLVLVGNLDPDRQGPASFHQEILSTLRPDDARRVHILGPKPSAFPYMVAADAQVLVSTNECSPLVNLESMILGTFVISSRVHGIPEVIADGERGLLVDPEDVADIARALRGFIDTRRDDPHRIASMIDAARTYVTEHHDMRHTGAAIARDLATVLSLPWAERLRGPAVNDYLQTQLVFRWALVKHDVVNACHIVRGHCHKLYDPEADVPESARLSLRRS